MLAQGTVGYARLAQAISEAQLAGEKGAPRTSLAQLADASRASVHGHDASPRNDHWFVSTGCRKGTVPAALQRDGPAAAERALHELVDAFGRDRVLVELWDHGDPLDRHRNDALAAVCDAGRCRGDRDEQRALRNAGAPSARARARGDTGAVFAGRDRRLVAGRTVRPPAVTR